MLEKMEDFFNNRVIGYEVHQLTAIEFAEEFYPYTASCLPIKKQAAVLDLGCGTGLELEYYFKLNPTAKITGIDVADDMLKILKNKFADKAVNVIKGSYFACPFGTDCFDAAVSVESLHHFTQNDKIPLYKKIFRALKPDGYFILTDYFARTDEEENLFFGEFSRLKAEQGINDRQFYHFDTPLTAEHEMQALHEAGFQSVKILKNWGATITIKAEK